MEKFFDRYAHKFDAIYDTESNLWNKIINRLFRKSMKIRFQKTLEECEPITGRTILDIGCGPGHYAIAFANKGASRVVGIDFAQTMINLARTKAIEAGVSQVCEFICDDFLSFEFEERFDYAIAMGFMDYIDKPEAVIRKVISITHRLALFSFPAAGGILAWQRKMRYKRKCKLYLYKPEDIERIFTTCGLYLIRIERIARDFFVKVSL